MGAKTLHTSFAGGEISPEMQGKIGDRYYLTGLQKCENFIVKPQGPVENRAGTKYVNRTKDYTKVSRLIPFTFSTTETMVIELGHQYIRLHTNGASLVAGDPVAAYAGGTPYAVGDVVSSGGTNYYCILVTTGNAPPNATYWYSMPSTNEYEFPSPYTSGISYDIADIFSLKFVQSEDVLTIVHPDYEQREIRRLGTYQWELKVIDFSAGITAPTGVAAAGYFKTTTPRDTLITPSEGDSDYKYEYVVTALDDDQNYQSIASSEVSVNSNLNSTGQENKITWSAVTGAVYYNVFKKQGGLYGFIGQLKTGGTLELWDNNIAPDMTYIPPVYDEDSPGNSLFSTSNNYPGAVSYHEQRRVLAGTSSRLQTVWMTKPASESNMSYSIPTRADDRINFRIAAREANTIRHIVPLNQLLLLTSSAVWIIRAAGDEALTPGNVSIKPQSYVGASNAQPAIINTTLVYAAAKGGHMIECGYNLQYSSFVSGDLSLRSAHLFDKYELVDIAYSRSPNPIVWTTSSSGKLLGFTYIPEQDIGAWHQHTTEGTFESCAVVSEGLEDFLYVAVKRNINGSDVRYIERFSSRLFENLKDSFFVDCGLSYEGRNSKYDSTTVLGSVTFGPTETMTLSGGTSWDSDETLTLTASSNAFLFPISTDLDDEVVLIDVDPDSDSFGTKIRCKIEATASTKIATIRPDKLVPVDLRSTALVSWEFARDAVLGLDHLEGEIVSILGDGAVYPQKTVSSGSVSLERPAAVIHAGLPYNSDMQTLPVVAQSDEILGQGKVKNVNKVWLKVYQSSGIFAGPSADKLVEAKQRTIEPYGSAPVLKTENIEIVVTPEWNDDGHVYVRQKDPLPLTLTGLVLDVTLGN